MDATIPEQRIIEQAVRLADRGAITGWSSLRLQGVGYLDGLEGDGRTTMPVRAVLGSGQVRGSEELDVLREPLDRSETQPVHGFLCTTAPRAVFDEMRRVGIIQAIVTMDMVSAAGLQTVQGQRDFTQARLSVRGARRALSALSHARDGSASPNESRLRLIWTLMARLPVPLLNRPLFDEDGNHLGTVDLFDPTCGLAGEFDGADHRTAKQHAQDVVRADRLRRAGVEVVHVTGTDLSRPRLVADRIRAARQRALVTVNRTWTTRIPDWYAHRS